MFYSMRGREARPATATWNVAKMFLQTGVFWLVFLFVIPALVWHLEGWLGYDRWRFTGAHWPWIGGALFAMGATLGAVSGTVMAILGRGTPLPTDCPSQLVVAGPYRYIRNPMVLAGLSQGVGVGLFLGSPMVVAYALCGAPVWDFVVRRWEEVDLSARFGESYERYRREVPCWRPRFPGYRPEVTKPKE
jgi:protein-S-isoprenylcysteine O-methyltransferase Ste14